MISDRGKKQIRRSMSFAIKLALGVVFAFPLIIGLLFSIHTETELSRLPLKLFSPSPTFENYLKVFQSIPILHYLKNTMVVVIVGISAQVVFSSLAAYGFVFFKFPLKNLLWTIIVSTMMVPGEVVVITNYVTIQNLKLVNTYGGLFITSLISGTSIFMMRQYYMQLPKEFKEAAVLDGCDDIKFLRKIAIPLSIPTISSLAIYQFVHLYNAYFWPLLVTNKDKWRTIQVGISYLVAGDVEEYGKILAAAMIALSPTLIAYIFGQDYIIKGLVSGGIKG